MSSTRFSGFGTKNEEDEASNDPVQRLRELAIEGHKKEKRKLQRGGMLPLAALFTAAGGTLVSKIVSDVYDLIKKKISGKGYKIPEHKTIDDKRDFVLKFMKKNINYFSALREKIL